MTLTRPAASLGLVRRCQDRDKHHLPEAPVPSPLVFLKGRDAAGRVSVIGYEHAKRAFRRGAAPKGDAVAA